MATESESQENSKKARRKEARKRVASAARNHAGRAVDRASLTTARARDFALRAGESSVARVRAMGVQARDRFQSGPVDDAPPGNLLEPHLCFVQSPRRPIPPLVMKDTLRVATYNVHRWQGTNGRSNPDVARAGYVISEMDADVIALQEVLRPFEPDGEDPLAMLCEELDLHLAFAVTRRHRRGQLGNAILSRYPITAISVLDISYSRIERRGALAAQLGQGGRQIGVVATHLSLVDRTRHRQVQSLLGHPQMNSGPTVLMGDMNAWRNCKGSKELDLLNAHNNFSWPASFPAGRPMLALDRIYARGADVVAVGHYDSPAARRASDHLPIIAEVRVKQVDSGS